MPAFQPPSFGKRKYIDEDDDDDEPTSKRLALEPVNPGLSNTSEYWVVQWRNPQARKHKTWDGDGVLVANRSKATLHDTDGTTLATGKADFPLFEGKNMKVNGKEIELDRAISESEYLSGTCFTGTTSGTSLPTSRSGAGLAKQFTPLKIGSTLAQSKAKLQPKPKMGTVPRPPQHKTDSGSGASAQSTSIHTQESHWTANWRKQQTKKNKTWDGDAYISLNDKKLVMLSEDGKFMGSTNWNGEALYSGYSTYISNKEVQLDAQVLASQLPLGEPRGNPVEDPIDRSPADTPSTKLTLAKAFISPGAFYGAPVKVKPKGPRHDPEAEGAIVMKGPDEYHSKQFNRHNFPVVPVVLDPIIARRMRPHQHEGVKFLYEAVMGMRKHEGQGCILADDMGLGKTLQTIALMWTLLKQNPYAAPNPVVSKVLVVCPVSLINNWKSEFHKWLGRDRIGIVLCDRDKKAANTFMNGKAQQVLIIGYERLRTVIDDLAVCIPPIGLIICDEGHRLKSANNKTAAMFKSLRTPRRIILSGTPIQNDLSEFHTMADFCNPGLLDDYSTFRRTYENPIIKGRAPGATAAEVKLGLSRSSQLLSISQSFVLRRNASLLKAVLPPKHEYVIFVTPTALQLSIFCKILNPDHLEDLVQASTADCLALISVLRKVSNSPILLRATADKAKATGSDETEVKTSIESALKLLPDRAQIEDTSLSGKLIVLSSLLDDVHKHTEEKCVLVSHFTSTLNILEAFCKKRSYSYSRLDGQTPAGKRQELVNAFNTSSSKRCFVFLLSSKAGGVGINLIGASRLCLIDCDWNPSHDLQSMARCHRDGQKRPVYIYRLLTAGAIDEKIYQRQVTKLGLSDSLMTTGSSSSKADSFTRKDLRDIFRVHPDTLCNTHDLLECPCDQNASAIEDDDPDKLFGETDSEDEEIEKGFIFASQVNFEKMDEVHTQRKRAGLAALGEWKHVNCLKDSADGEIHDNVLRRLVQSQQEEYSRLQPNFPSPDTPESERNSGVGYPTADKVPRATVSFLFQKTTMAQEPVAVEVES